MTMPPCEAPTMFRLGKGAVSAPCLDLGPVGHCHVYYSSFAVVAVSVRLPTSSRPPIIHVDAPSLAESWLATLRRFCLLAFAQLREKASIWRTLGVGIENLWNRCCRHENKIYKVSQASKAKSNITSFRLFTKHRLQNHNPKPQPNSSPQSQFFVGTMGATIHTWTCCRCGMGAMLYDTTVQCLEASCQHHRCPTCTYFEDSVRSRA
ncbi:hypothetical protein HDV63DRAFT_212719 [Trichoderma sp. SZMC 28014]